jgi:uncharacterized protein YqgQ
MKRNEWTLEFHNLISSIIYHKLNFVYIKFKNYMYEHIQDEITDLYSRNFIKFLYALKKSCHT